MTHRGQPFVVEVRRKPNADYASKPGDARRSGRIDAQRGVAAVCVEFKDIGSQIEARLGVMTVGSVTHDPTKRAYFWAVFLPGLPREHSKSVDDAEACKAAIERKVREWCEAAGLISVRRK